MSQTVIIRPHQSFLDIAIQEHGNLKAVIDLAVLNEVSITDPLINGDQLEISSPITASIEIVAFFKKHKINPATMLES